MCGRYLLSTSGDDLQTRFDFSETGLAIRPRFNIAPTQEVLAVIADGPRRRAELLRWGLIPSWAKEPPTGTDLINARAETVAEKPSFRSAFKRRRCLVPATGFYEWKRDGTRKQPMLVRLVSGEPFAMAGIWEIWQPPTGDLIRSAAIITTPPNALLAPIHNRMPAILLPEAESLWLDPDLDDPAVLSRLLRPYPAEAMEAYPVSPFVNSPHNEGPECTRRVA